MDAFQDAVKIQKELDARNAGLSPSRQMRNLKAVGIRAWYGPPAVPVREVIEQLKRGELHEATEATEQGQRRMNEMLDLGRKLSHPFRLAFTLHHTTIVQQLCREEEVVQERAEELIAIAEEQGFPLWLATGTFQRGWALAAKGQEEEGITQLHHGVSQYDKTGAELGRPYQLALLAEAQGKTGDVEARLRLLDDALAAVERSGERCWEGEIYRLKGELLLTAEAKAEACFRKALDIARQQAAKSWELRAARSMARLWQRQSKQAEGRELLQGIYDWFTEGFDTKDLREAEALLRELGGNVKGPEERQSSKGKAQKAKLEPEEEQSLATPLPARLLSTPLSQETQAEIDSTQHAARNTQTLDPGRSDSRLSAPSPQPLAPNAFRNDGEYWTLTFERTACRIAGTLGMQYLAQLLQQPQHEVHVRTLAGEPTPNEPRLATLAVSSTLAQRLQELREELAEAEAFHDGGRVERLQAELEEVTDTLVQQTRSQRKASPSPDERLRLNVTRAIKTAIKKIASVHPSLGRYLTQTIKTGTLCSYTPPESSSIDWQV